MSEASACLIATLTTTVPPVVRRARHFPRASTAPRVPAFSRAPGDARSVPLWQHRFFLHVSSQASCFQEMAVDRAIAEFRLPGLLDADRTRTFWTPGPPGRRPRT